MPDEKQRQQELEDEFFGEKDALKLPEVDANAAGPVQNLRHETGVSLKESADTNTAAHLIDRLQSENKLPESMYAEQLAKFLEFLGKKLGIKIEVDGEGTLFPDNTRTLSLTTSNLAIFLRRGALASTFLLPLVMSSEALAQQLQPGMSLINEGVDVVANQGHQMFHWEHLLSLLLLLGISAVVAGKLIKKFKKTDQEKLANDSYKKYEEAKKKGDKDAMDAAKKDIFTGAMAELPGEIEGAIGQVKEIDHAELKKAFGIKKLVDEAISKAISELEKVMILPEKKSVGILNKIKEKVLKIFDDQVVKLESLYEKLTKELSKAPAGSYLSQQIEFEKKKLKYHLDYIKLMRKKWLVIMQSAKNELISKGDNMQLSEEDKLSKDINDLKEELNTVIDQQGTYSPDDFRAKVAELDAKISGKTPGATVEETEVGGDKITLLHGGNYDHSTGIDYKINGQEFHSDLNEHFSAQIWIGDDKKIRMNFNHKGVLVDFQNLVVGDNGFELQKTGQALVDYLEEKQADATINATEASAELSPDAEPVLGSLANAVIAVSSQIENDAYKGFGTKIEADDEAIKYHLMRVHREYFQKKPKVVVRFTLEEGYWKKALAELDKQSDVPKSTVNFNYENEKGEKMSINQPMKKFNIAIDGKQVTILVTATEQYKAISGEVRILFDPNDGFTQEQLKKVFAEVSKRLGLNDHLKPVTPKAKDKLRKWIKEIRKEEADPAGASVQVHNEYSAETVEASSLKELRKQGLHSLYHQFDLNVLQSMFKSGSLMATATRWSKGVLKSGMSSSTDLTNGGGTEVFMRAHTNSSVKTSSWASDKPAVVFAPKLFTRMDCYCYSSDKYGSKMPGVFDQRISPKKLLQVLSGAYNSGHEIMFHDAVNLADAQYIVYGNPASVISQLESIGITQIGGKPLKKAVITREQFKSINF